jgi:hypothetical protein
MLTYTPGIHGFTVMTAQTRAALKDLWDSDPRHPFFTLDFMRSSRKIGTNFEPMRPGIVLHGSGPYRPLSLAEAAAELDADIVARALLALQGDDWIMEFPQEFEKEAGPLNAEYDLMSSLVLPGCIYLYDADLEHTVEELLATHGESLSEEDHSLWILGIFAAGPTQSAHEKIAATQAVMSYRSAWEICHDVVNECPAAIRITDPVIHPDRAGYIE